MATAINYVKFVRGTVNAFNNLTEKNSDTLYFISNADDARGALYLGEKLISKDISNISELRDINLENLLDGQMLVYDGEKSQWINKAIIDAIGLMVGASSNSQGKNGLVPAPGIGQQDMFLRGDGTWSLPQSTLQLSADGKTIDVLDDGQTIALKDFGVKYYKYVAKTESEEAHYEIQIVDDKHPWKSQLEPKVIEEEGQFVLGWFEPNTSTVEGFQDSLVDLTNRVNGLEIEVSSVNNVLSYLNETVNAKADKSKVYTKTETDARIAEEIAKVNHLTRKTFASIKEAEIFIMLEERPENYIYMILSDNLLSDNKYDEYIYVDGALEKVGFWQTDLSDYVTKTEFEGLDTKVNNLEALLNNKADKAEVEEIAIKIETINTTVNSLTEFLNSNYFVNREDYEEDMNQVRESVTWRDL